MIVDEAREEAVGKASGRDFCEHGAKSGSGNRNGHRLGRLKNAEGAIKYAAPQVADRAEAFRSQIRAVISEHSRSWSA